MIPHSASFTRSNNAFDAELKKGFPKDIFVKSLKEVIKLYIN
jgi:hypothetical protein